MGVPFVLALTGLFVWVAAMVVGVTRALRQLRRKGFSGPGAFLGLLALTLVTPIAGGVAGAVLGRPDERELMAFVGFGVGLVCGLGGMAVLARMLPRRKVRSGPRRPPGLPFRVLGFVSLGVAVLLPVVRLWTGERWATAVNLWIPCSALTAWLFYLGRRARVVERPQPENPRAVVLWIRSFTAEHRLFGERAIYDEDVANGLVPGGIMRRKKQFMTFEGYFGHAVDSLLGEGYGLGNPRDYVPAGGMAEEYALDGRWRERFGELVAGSRCVITAPDDWPELRFELGVIRDVGARGKLFVFTPPAATRWTWGRSVFYGPAPLTWAEFAEAVGDDVGYDLGEDPGPGAVVTFDDEGRADVLAQDVTEPEGYIYVVRDHLRAE